MLAVFAEFERVSSASGFGPGSPRLGRRAAVSRPSG
jgi:hypothetical protein